MNIYTALLLTTMENLRVIDIGVNMAHRTFRSHWRDVVQQAVRAGADTLVLTGTSLRTCQEHCDMAQTWYDEHSTKNLYFTVGIHPHDAKSFDRDTLEALRDLLQHPLAVAVGECGLDFNRNFSPPHVQESVFREQVKLACTLAKPLFVHEREAHKELLKILDQVSADDSVPPLPPIVVHCFTGSEAEALEYVRRGYYIGFTGTICKKERGAPLREILPKLPLDRLMVETDAPFMGFGKGRRNSRPEDVVEVARQLAETIHRPFEEVCETTTATAQFFFGINK